MLTVKEEELKKILPIDGPSISEVKSYLEKYNDEYIVIKCGGSVLVDQNLFDHFLDNISTLKKLGFITIVVHGGGKRISNKLSEAGIKSNFFNEPAYTTTIPAQFVKKFNARVVPIYIERSKDNKFNLEIYEPLIFNKKYSVQQITDELNQLLEKMILKNPDQWIWTHNRWK